jgi:hypothetical protein
MISHENEDKVQDGQRAGPCHCPRSILDSGEVAGQRPGAVENMSHELYTGDRADQLPSTKNGRQNPIL